MPRKLLVSTTSQRRKVTPVELEDFARKLHEALDAKGWSQSTLAQEAFGCKKDYRGINVPRKRDQVSAYVNGKRLPDEANLKLICEALNIRPSDLIPERGKALIDRHKPSLLTVIENDGRMRIRLDQAYDLKTASRILQVIMEANEAVQA